MIDYQRRWVTVREAAPVIGKKPKTIYESIRQGRFPFEFRRDGRSILISAQDLGLIPPDSQLPKPQSASAAAK